MADGEYDVNFHHFMEELLRCILETKNCSYAPMGYYPKDLILPSFNAVVCATADIIEAFTDQMREQLKAVNDYMSDKDKCVQFIEHLGRDIFQHNVFTWDLFRAFLAIMCELASNAYKSNRVYFCDDLIVSSAYYIKHNFVDPIQVLGGWKSFQVDCLLISLKKVALVSNCEEPLDLEKFQTERKNVFEDQKKISFSYDGEKLAQIFYNKTENSMKLQFLQKERVSDGNVWDETIYRISSCSGSPNGKILHLRSFVLAYYVTLMGIGVLKVIQQVI